MRSELAAMALAVAFRPPTVGLDIGSSGVKAVALRQTRGGWTLAAAGELPLFPATADAATPAAEDVSGAVRQLLDALKLRRNRVAAALSGHAVIVKRLSLPAMSQAELAEAIPWEAEQYIPFDLADVQLDYQVMTSRADIRSALDVLLVAAKKDRIEDRAAVIAQAGRQAVVLDIEAFALANAYQMNYAERLDALAALVHIGRSATITCLLERGQLAFTRDISLGARLYGEALQRELGLDASQAEQALRGLVPAPLSREHVGGVLRETTGQIILEIRKTLDFYRATAPIEKLNRIVVSGGACQAEGLMELLGMEFGAPVEVFDPFRRVTRPKRTDGVQPAGPGYAVAVGLAMRREGDR